MKTNKLANNATVGEPFKKDILSMMWKTAESLGTEDIKAPSLGFDDILAVARNVCESADRGDIRSAMHGCLANAEQRLREWFEEHRPTEPADKRILLRDHLRRIISGQMGRNGFPLFYEAMETLDSDDGPFTIAFADILELGSVTDNTAKAPEMTHLGMNVIDED
ncbi:MAG: hypothetical protein FWG50_03470 [Kiritimatiellaeota bacterium]|nr:hypothetical protein [Kiritimatiellota bacterium]